MLNFAADDAAHVGETEAFLPLREACVGEASVSIAFRQERRTEVEASPSARFRGRDFRSDDFCLDQSIAPSGAPTGHALADVLRHPGIWRRSAPATGMDAQSTGFADLDALLPGGGWPRGALTEILIEADGIGELALLAPTLAQLTRAGRRVVLIAPPYIPYAPALAAAGIDLDRLVQVDANALDRHWSAEQCLRSGCCAAVLNWLPDADYRRLRRLQIAAETGATLGFVFRSAAAASQASPAALRVRVRGGEAGSTIEIVKCRGSLAGRRQGFRLRVPGDSQP
jgi:hypothetical protein